MSRLIKIIVGTGVCLAALAVAALMWWILRDEGPEAVDLATAVASVEAAVADDGSDPSSVDAEATGAEAAQTTESTEAPATTSATNQDVPDDASTTTVIESTEQVTTTSTSADDEPAIEATTTSETDPDTSVTDDVPAAGTDEDTETTPADVAGAALAGVWTVVTAEGDGDLSDEPAVSFAGYRVVEVLAGGVDESTAVGRTTAVAGSIQLSSTALVAATVEVDMSTLRTDDSHRDSHARESLNTKEFPLAVFTLTEPLELPVEAYEGEPFSGPAWGDLTIKGVTNRAVFDLSAQLVNDTIVVVGSSEVVFSDYGVTAPTSRSVISVEDHGIMEFQLILTR